MYQQRGTSRNCETLKSRNFLEENKEKRHSAADNAVDDTSTLSTMLNLYSVSTLLLGTCYLPICLGTCYLPIYLLTLSTVVLHQIPHLAISICCIFPPTPPLWILNRQIYRRPEQVTDRYRSSKCEVNSYEAGCTNTVDYQYCSSVGTRKTKSHSTVVGLFYFELLSPAGFESISELRQQTLDV